MKKILSALFIVLLISTTGSAQVAPSARITIEVFPMNPQSGPHNYFGVTVKLDRIYDQDITVSGYMYDLGNAPDTYNPYSVTVYAGYTTNSSSSTQYQTGPASEGTASIASISPSLVSAGALVYNTQELFTGDTYLNFDGEVASAGSFHHYGLYNILYNTSIGSGAIDREGWADDVRDAAKTYYTNYGAGYFGSLIPTDESDTIFNRTKYYADASKFIEHLTDIGPSSLSYARYVVDTSSSIDGTNKALFDDIVDLADSSFEGTLTDPAAYEQSLTRLANAWVSANSGNMYSVSAQFTGSIISIGLSSAQFWRQNIDSLCDPSDLVYFPYARKTSFDNMAVIYNGYNDYYDAPLGGPSAVEIRPPAPRPYFFAQIIAVDLAGAIVSGGISAIRGGSAKNVAISAGIGAVVASSGIVGRLAKGIKSFVEWLW
jgi:hypothetical protein